MSEAQKEDPNVVFCRKFGGTTENQSECVTTMKAFDQQANIAELGEKIGTELSRIFNKPRDEIMTVAHQEQAQSAEVATETSAETKGTA